MSDGTDVDVADAAADVVTFTCGESDFGTAFESRDDENRMLLMYSVDDAKIGVIAHEPTLLKVSCDNMICGNCIESNCQISEKNKSICNNNWIIIPF